MNVCSKEKYVMSVSEAHVELWRLGNGASARRGESVSRRRASAWLASVIPSLVSGSHPPTFTNRFYTQYVIHLPCKSCDWMPLKAYKARVVFCEHPSLVSSLSYALQTAPERIFYTQP